MKNYNVCIARKYVVMLIKGSQALIKEPGMIGLCSQGTGRGQGETASGYVRRGSGWTSEGISSRTTWSGTGRGHPGVFGVPILGGVQGLPGCGTLGWEQGGVWAQVGLNGLGDLFPPK